MERLTREWDHEKLTAIAAWRVRQCLQRGLEERLSARNLGDNAGILAAAEIQQRMRDHGTPIILAVDRAEGMRSVGAEVELRPIDLTLNGDRGAVPPGPGQAVGAARQEQRVSAEGLPRPPMAAPPCSHSLVSHGTVCEIPLAPAVFCRFTPAAPRPVVRA